MIVQNSSGKPRITILADKPNWAYDICAQQLVKHLHNDFSITIKYVREKPILEENMFDLLHVCFWGEKYHTQFNIPPNKIVKEISSHRWQYDRQYGPCSAKYFVKKFLQDASFFCTTSLRLYNLLVPFIPNIHHVANGIDTKKFFVSDNPSLGEMRLGWAGNSKDPVKGIEKILCPASKEYNLELADGTLSYDKIATFYQYKDLYVVASEHEGTPLPLIEAMACGCFPVCCDVGIVPEIIQHKRNGYIVTKRTIKNFKYAFLWCENNLEYIRSQRKIISEEIHKKRNWELCSQTYKNLWFYALDNINNKKNYNKNITLLKKIFHYFN